MPEPGRDYPRTWAEFCRMFPDDDACASYLERLSWPDGFVCPACGAVARQPWRGSRRRLVCPACEHQTTVTSGTLFQGTRTPLSRWFAAAWMIATAEQGISAKDLQRRLGLASYETAWMLLHRYRRAMVRSGRPRLSGVVEVGETPVGRRSVVALAVEDRGDEPGRVRMQRAISTGPARLAAFVAWAVEPGTVVRTADPGTSGVLLEHGYLAPPQSAPEPASAPAPEPKAAPEAASAPEAEPEAELKAASGPAPEPASGGPAPAPGPRPASAPGPGPGPGRPPLAYAELVARLLRRWLTDTHQGAASPAQLDWYLDEFTFRFNRRWATHRGLLFYRLIEEAVVTPPLPYESVAATRSERIGQAGLEPRG
jgi:transposase-like protein